MEVVSALVMVLEIVFIWDFIISGRKAQDLNAIEHMIEVMK